MSANILPAKTQAEQFLASTFEACKAQLPGTAGVAKWREEAFHVFEALGLPHRRIEAWHYTDLRALMREALPVAAAPRAERLDAWRESFPGGPASRVVLADGFFAPHLSSALPDGLKVTSLAGVLAGGRPDLITLLASQNLGAQDPMAALNAALMQDGVVIEAAPGAVIAEPLHLIHLTSSPAAQFSRSALIAGAGASVRLAESCRPARGDAASQVNNCLMVFLGEGARLDHTAMVTRSAAGGIRLDTMIARLGAGAKFDSFALVSGIGLVRRQIFLRFEAPGAQASLSGVSLLAGREHADTTLQVEHAAPGCVSRETFKYILDEDSTGVFQGRIHVAPGAQKTDGKMLCKAMLLSDRAAMNNKPELEIFADDVACGHGATCGGLDIDQLFYLQTRGLPLPEAEALLLEAFAGELIDAIGHDGLKNEYRGAARAWLSARHKTLAAPERQGALSAQL